LTDVTYDTDEMLCPEHNEKMKKAHEKEQIMLKHLTLQRIKHLDKLAAAAESQGEDEAQALNQTKLRVLGLISNLQLQCVCSSVPVNEGGFAQRNVASQQASQVEQLMRENSYDILAGNLAVVEIPYTDDEVGALIDAKLLSDDFVPPKPLALFDEGKDKKDGSWMINFEDEKYQMNLRRFAIIDGNNRIIALVRITAEIPDFLENTSLNAYLVDLNIHDGLAVQLASMRCNKLSHSFIEDTPGDKIFQFQCVIDVFKKTLPKPKKKGAAEPKLVVTAVCKWIEKNAKDLVDLLPKEFQHSTVVLDATTKEQQTFKEPRVAAYVRVATHVSKEFVRWLQQRYAAHQSGVQPLTQGEKKVFVHHFIKMQIVYEDENPMQFLQEKANQVDRALTISANYKSWSPERRKLFILYQSYETEALVCSKHVMAEVPVLCKRMEAHLQELHDKHKEDPELQQLVPFPVSAHPEHPLVTNMAKMNEGTRDFDVFCNLWSRSAFAQTSGPRKKKEARVYQLPSARNEFDLSFFPRLVQDAYGKVTADMHIVTAERKRAEAEKAKLAKVEEAKQAAIEAAKKKLEEDRKAAQVATLATLAVNTVTGSDNRVAPDAAAESADKEAVCKFCYGSSSFYLFI
jgi:hypothetical protein